VMSGMMPMSQLEPIPSASPASASTASGTRVSFCPLARGKPCWSKRGKASRSNVEGWSLATADAVVACQLASGCAVYMGCSNVHGRT
jgi:hypothetical protein